MRKQGNTIEIQEEVRIPGTDVILEKGDKIQIEEIAAFKNDIWNIVQNYMDETGFRGSEAAEQAGRMFGEEIYETMATKMPSNMFKAFIDSIKQGLS